MSTEKELQAMTEKLQDYLLDGELYKTITLKGDSGDSLIKMTIGGMLDRIATLEASGDSAGVAAAARAAITQAQNAQSDAFWQLAGREAKSNADSWSWYLQKVGEGDEQSHRDYGQETGIRTRLERLLQLDSAQPALSDARRRTATLDDQLKSNWEEGDSSGDYWWENGAPKAPRDA